MSSNGITNMESGKFRYITIADHNPDHWDELLSIAKSYDFYAYIFHKPDTEEGRNHVHILCMSHSPLVIKNHYKRWGDVIPINLLQKVLVPKRFARYMLHLDNDEKIKYDISSIHTNSLDHFSNLISQSFKPDTLSMWHDYCALRQHRMSPDEFLDKYRSEISELGMYQRFGIYSKIFDAGCVSFPAHDGANQGHNSSSSPTD